ncbi:MAG: (2Fe-2S)-binding protein [Leptospirales bacterium]|nr:(2Fe-2S)-binding protein [Leptospirales bacterium]
MYVCVCHAVTDGEIRKAVEGGASTLREVQASLPVGARCGACLDFAEHLVDEHHGHCQRSVRAAG